MSSTSLTSAALATQNVLTGHAPACHPDDDCFTEDSLIGFHSDYDFDADVPRPVNEFDDNLGEMEEELGGNDNGARIVMAENIVAHMTIEQEIAMAHPNVADRDSRMAPRTVGDEMAGPRREEIHADSSDDDSDVNSVPATSTGEVSLAGAVQPAAVEGSGRHIPNYKNCVGLSFSDHVKAAFIERMERKGLLSRAFTPEKYAKYFTIVKDGRHAVSPPEGSSKSERDVFVAERRRIALNFEIVNERLIYKKGKRLVVLIEDALDAAAEIHDNTAHPGYHKTWDHVRSRYYGITENDVAWLVKHCLYCKSNGANTLKSSHKPIVVNTLKSPHKPFVPSSAMELVQLDVVDLRKHPSGDYYWIVHLKDHFLKTSWVYPLKGKHSVSVAKILNRWMKQNGIPRMIQCDNGKEFIGACIRLLRKRGVVMVNGRPSKPQLQGLVEQGNVFIKKKITEWQSQNIRTDWAHSLDFIGKAINTSTCGGLPAGYNPHLAMYGFDRQLEFDKKINDIDMTDAEATLYICGPSPN